MCNVILKMSVNNISMETVSVIIEKGLMLWLQEQLKLIENITSKNTPMNINHTNKKIEHMLFMFRHMIYVLKNYRNDNNIIDKRFFTSKRLYNTILNKIIEFINDKRASNYVNEFINVFIEIFKIFKYPKEFNNFYNQIPSLIDKHSQHEVLYEELPEKLPEELLEKDSEELPKYNLRKRKFVDYAC